MNLWWHLILPLVLLQYTPFTSYTSFNCLVWVGAWLYDLEFLWPFLFCNTLSLVSTFYVIGFFIDTSMFSRMMHVHKIPAPLYVLGDVCVHFIPSVYMGSSLFLLKTKWQNIFETYSNAYVHAGAYSVCLNMLYGALYNFQPDLVYVPLSSGQWRWAWASFTAFSFLYNAVLNLQIA